MKIAIVTRKMIIGGVERALIAMLKQFDYSQVEIDLYLESLDGELFDEIPPEVNCIPLPTVHGTKAIRHPLIAIRKLFVLAKLHAKHYSYIEQCYLSSRMLMPVSEKYDIAIAYHAPNTIPVFYVIDSLKAKKKILWLHGDLESNAGDTKLAIRYHRQFDKVFAVSDSAKQSFIKYHPEMAGQTTTFFNYVDAEFIRCKAMEGPSFTDNFNGKRLLSIGRLDAQKGFDMAITACKALIDRGYQIRWYICGEGNAREELEQMIQENHLEDVFFLLGNQPNPYRYLKDCDLYVQPSRSEGYCTTTNEARILFKPVITTAVSGASEQFKNGVTGWIIPISAEAIEEKIAYCLDHPENIAEIRTELEKSVIHTSEDLEKIFE